ncbi:SGNH/GDSL hydrolase family protein [soil metagenome]
MTTVAATAVVVLPFFAASGAHAAGTAPRWTASWAVAARDYNEPSPVPGIATPPALMLRDQTVRVRVDPAAGGTAMRVRFSNAFGTAPLHIAAASVARGTGGDALSPGSIRTLRFNGQRDATVAPGDQVWSDAVPLTVTPRQPLAVSAYIDAETRAATAYTGPAPVSWLVPGDATGMAKLQRAAVSPWGHFITGIDVATTATASSSPASTPPVVVAFGDSITYGVGAVSGTDGSYPTRLGQRLRAQPGSTGKTGGAAKTASVPSVINVGIGGNRLLTDGIGQKALDRFDRDVLSQSGVTHTIILIGTNDIGLSSLPGAAPMSVERLTAGLQRLIDSARTQGVKVLLGTVTPFKGSGYWSDENEAMRQALNRWIRGRQNVAGVVDFDVALRDRKNAVSLNPKYDSGDHLHPSDAGYAAMAEAVDVRELQP